MSSREVNEARIFVDLSADKLSLFDCCIPIFGFDETIHILQERAAIIMSIHCDDEARSSRNVRAEMNHLRSLCGPRKLLA